MRSDFGDNARLQHIHDAIIEIESYVQKLSYEEFQSNSMMYYACVKQLEIIGEAANHLSTDLKNSEPEIQWREIIDLRNILIHEYFGVDTKIVWDIIKVDIPEFKTRVIKIINSKKLISPD